MHLSQKEKDKLIKILNLTKSDNDNEAVTALRTAQKIIQSKNIDWGCMLNGQQNTSYRGSHYRYTSNDLNQAEEDGFADGYKYGFKKGKESGFTLGYTKGKKEGIDFARQEQEHSTSETIRQKYRPKEIDQDNPRIEDISKIESLFIKLGGLDPDACGFSSFYISVKRFYEKNGWISTKQYNALKEIYQRHA